MLNPSLPIFTIRHPLKKRLCDLAIVGFSAILLSAVLAFIGFLVRMKIVITVLLCQKRPGGNSKPFTIYKFCTIADERGERQFIGGCRPVDHLRDNF